MAKDYNFTMDGHPNIYNNYSARKLNVYFSEPEAGVNQDTGIVLFIPGFGANANSNVYKKMRSVFADKHNLVTVQCDYFGWEFMQTERLPESVIKFNDMGIMQALDNITAVTALAEIIRDNGLVFNAGKIIAYGHSHGAYLAYLCNIFAPSLFSLIIDNSAWLFPGYIMGGRALFSKGKTYQFDYIAKSILKDMEIIHLPSVYKKVENQCTIHSFHGADDTLISLAEKKRFCLLLDKCLLHEVTSENVDLDIFRSSSHGLDADFLLMFDHVLQNENIQFKYKDMISIESNRIETSMYNYEIDYASSVPILNMYSKV